MKTLDESKLIRSFGLFVGLVSGGIGAYLTYRTGQPRWVLFAVSAYFLVGGLLVQPILRPVFIQWMRLASALGWFNTRVILGLLLYFLFTPIGLVQRLFGRDSLRLARPKDASLWVPRLVPVGGKNRYYRQF